jgi:phosphoribosylanthranilate isomerase
VPVEIKFCGLTRAGDAARAAELGARYVGAILADGPRLLTPVQAREVLGAAHGPLRVAVVGAGDPAALAARATAAGADIVQLHGDPTAADVSAIRRYFSGRIWAVVRVGDAGLPPGTSALFDSAHAVVLDAKVAGRLGGSGVKFDWAAVANALIPLRGRAALVLAGGLTPDNIVEALERLDPDVVDVSSGVEASPGVKDPERMRRFAHAVSTWHSPPRAR